MVIGNLTKDPEMRYTPNGAAVTSFTVATNRKWTGQDGNPGEEVEFHDITAWGKLAETASQILKKGAPAYVEGRLRTRSWEGQDGVKRYKTEIIAENLIALSSKGSGNYTPADNPVEEISKPAKKAEKTEDKDDSADSKDDEINIEDIPF
jgi:single-strand DNA-binding protein